MSKVKQIDTIKEYAEQAHSNLTILLDELKKLKINFGEQSIISKTKEFIKNEKRHMKALSSIFDPFSAQISLYCNEFIRKLNKIQFEDKKQFEALVKDINATIEEMTSIGSQLKQVSQQPNDSTSFLFRNGPSKHITSELISRYPGSYLYREYMNERRTSDGEIFIDYDIKNEIYIAKYMKGEESLLNDIQRMNDEEKAELMKELDFLELPIKQSFFPIIGESDDHSVMNAWRENKVVYVGNNSSLNLSNLLKQNHLLEGIFSAQQVKDIHYSKYKNEMQLFLDLEYAHIIEDYLKNGKEIINEKLLNSKVNIGKLLSEFQQCKIQLKNTELKKLQSYNSTSNIFKQSQIMKKPYDISLQEILPIHNWKLIFRASEHSFLSKSFHQICDSYANTMIIVQSKDGLIFSGYTTKTWKCEYPNDFICMFAFVEYI